MISSLLWWKKGDREALLILTKKEDQLLGELQEYIFSQTKIQENSTLKIA